MVSFIFLTVSLLLGGAASAFDATAWQSSGGSTNWLPWPENEYLEEGASPDRVGMTLSGGGDRAFIASIGYLRYSCYNSVVTSYDQIARCATFTAPFTGWA